MTLHVLTESPSHTMATSLTQFEAAFTYPLGPHRHFSIVHGDDYTRFFCAIGTACCVVDEHEGRVNGCISVALRPLRCPGGEEQLCAYIGDLKVAQAARGGRTLLRLATTAKHWIGEAANAAYAVVMDGSRALPENYTGRLSIPLFLPLARLLVLRVPTAMADVTELWRSDQACGQSCFRALSMGCYAGLGHSASVATRSAMAPQWLVEPNHLACGRVEDTARAKRLIADDGREMRSAHCSSFAYRDPEAGALLLRHACQIARHSGYEWLFVAVPEAEGRCLLDSLGFDGVTVAPAMVYGSGFVPDQKWNIDTAEI